MATDLRRLLQVLADQAVEFVVIGGVALVLHGSARFTKDLDICYARDRTNLRRLAAALAPLEPRLRDAPVGLPFVLDAAALHAGLNFTLTTHAGDLDLFGEVPGVGGYAALAPQAVPITSHGVQVKVIDLDSLERAKAAAGRAKDALDIAAIRLIRERQRR